MDNKIIFVKKKLRRHSKKFLLFLFIGIFKTFLVILFSWLLIDILHIKALLSSTVVIVSVFLIAYFAYVITKVIKPAFLKYVYATVGFNIAAILLIWFFVDFIGFSGAFSSAIVIGMLFLLRYLFLNKIGLIQYD